MINLFDLLLILIIRNIFDIDNTFFLEIYLKEMNVEGSRHEYQFEIKFWFLSIIFRIVNLSKQMLQKNKRKVNIQISFMDFINDDVCNVLERLRVVDKSH
jgi:hypothetical protein